MNILPTAVMLSTSIGALVVYVGSRHQRVIRRGPRPALRRIGWGILAIAFVALLGWFDLPAAIFTWVTFVMLPWSTIPLLIAWRDHRRRTSA